MQSLPGFAERQKGSGVQVPHSCLYCNSRRENNNVTALRGGKAFSRMKLKSGDLLHGDREFSQAQERSLGQRQGTVRPVLSCYGRLLLREGLFFYGWGACASEKTMSSDHGRAASFMGVRAHPGKRDRVCGTGWSPYGKKVHGNPPQRAVGAGRRSGLGECSGSGLSACGRSVLSWMGSSFWIRSVCRRSGPGRCVFPVGGPGRARFGRRRETKIPRSWKDSGGSLRFGINRR